MSQGPPSRGARAFTGRVLFWAAIAAAAYGLHLLGGLWVGPGRVPGLSDRLAADGYLFLIAVCIAILLTRGVRRLSSDERSAEAREIKRELCELMQESRIESFRAHLEARERSASDAVKLEREVERLRRRVHQLTGEATVAHSRFNAAQESLRREAEYYRKESSRLIVEDERLRESLRQAHVDLAYIKDRVSRVVTRRRPTIVNRMRDLVLGHTPSDDVLELMQGLEALGTLPLSERGRAC